MELMTSIEGTIKASIMPIRKRTARREDALLHTASKVQSVANRQVTTRSSLPTGSLRIIYSAGNSPTRNPT